MYLDSCYASIQKTLQTKCHNEGRAWKVKVSKPSLGCQALPTPTCCRNQTNLSSVHVLKMLHVNTDMKNSSNHKGTLKLFFAS